MNTAQFEASLDTLHRLATALELADDKALEALVKAKAAPTHTASGLLWPNHRRELEPWQKLAASARKFRREALEHLAWLRAPEHAKGPK